MDSDIQQQYQLHHFQRAPQPQKQQLNSLTRYRSAPSTYFTSFLDGSTSVHDTINVTITHENPDNYDQHRPLSPETETIFAKFMSTVNDPLSSKLCDIPENSPVPTEFRVSVKKEQQQVLIHRPPVQQYSGHPSPPPVIFSPHKPPLAKHSLNHSPTSSNSSMGSPFGAPSSTSINSMTQQLKMRASTNTPNSPASNHAFSSLFRVPGSMAMDSTQMKIGVAGTGINYPVPNPAIISHAVRAPSLSMAMDSIPRQMRIGAGGNAPDLVRHNSLPAGFLANIDIDDGFAAVRNIGNLEANSHGSRGGNESSAFPASAGRSNNAQINFSSTLINAMSSKNNTDNGGCYLTGFPIGSWDDSMLLSNNFGNIEEDDDHKAFPDLYSPEKQDEATAKNRPPILLAHHLSLPKNALEKLLQLQDNSVPCQIRAKRGMATHPRSVAERVRRTRISERMRKLQDLVPNMDKQTNTADMLDLAVEYIKDLQKQVEVLADNRAKCTCSG